MNGFISNVQELPHCQKENGIVKIVNSLKKIN